MFDLRRELMNLSYREVEISLNDLFPKLNIERVWARFSHLKKADVHQTVYAVVRSLAEGGYSLLLEEQGFWQEGFEKFNWHSHQCCALLALVLKVLGFEVYYLEGFRVRDYVPRSGILEKVMPHEEENIVLRNEFEKLGRIPSSCVEVVIKGKQYFISPTHVRLNPENLSLYALLVPECYIDFMGCFRHQGDALKSGIYLKSIKPEANVQRHNFDKRIVWTNQTSQDEKLGYFATFLRMKIE